MKNLAFRPIDITLALIMALPTQVMCLEVNDFVPGKQKVIRHENNLIRYFPASVAEDKKHYYIQARTELRSSVITEPVLIVDGTYRVECLQNDGVILPLIEVVDFRQANQINSPFLSGADRSAIFEKYEGQIAQISGFSITKSLSDDLDPKEALILAAVCGRPISEVYVFSPGKHK